MFQKSHYKVTVFIMVLAALLLGVSLAAYAKQVEPTCEEGYVRCEGGPPIVGRLTLDYIGVQCDLVCTMAYTISFSGCCANCFDACKNSCNMKFGPETKSLDIGDNNGDGVINLEDMMKSAYFKDIVLEGYGPSQCRSRTGGEDIKITNVVGMQATNIDKDAEKELLVDVVMVYFLCCPQ